MTSKDFWRQQQQRWDDPEESMDAYFERLKRQRAEAAARSGETSRTPIFVDALDAQVSTTDISKKRQDYNRPTAEVKKRPRLTPLDKGDYSARCIQKVGPQDRASTTSGLSPADGDTKLRSSAIVTETSVSVADCDSSPSLLFSDGKVLRSKHSQEPLVAVSSTKRPPVTRAATTTINRPRMASPEPGPSRMQSDTAVSLTSGRKSTSVPKQVRRVVVPSIQPTCPTENTSISHHKASTRAPRLLKIDKTPVAPGDSSFLTDPSSSPPLPSSSPLEEDAPLKRKPRAIPAHKISKLTAPPAKAGKAAVVKLYPSEWAKKLQPPLDPEASTPTPALPLGDKTKFLEGLKVYYFGGDREHASEGTKTRMLHLVQYGATLLPELDVSNVTHVVHCKHSSKKHFLRVTGLKSLDELPARAPVVTWEWVVRCHGHKKVSPCGEFAVWREAPPDYEIDKSFSEKLARAKQSMGLKRHNSVVPEADISNISEFTKSHIDLNGLGSQAGSQSLDSIQGSQSFLEYESSEYGDMSDDETESEAESNLYHRPIPAGFKCDEVSGEGPPADCPNQNVIIVLEELKGLHAAKRGSEDKWKVYSLTKAIAALRKHPKPIRSLQDAQALRGVGKKTAKKILEIVNTGALRRIAYENTEEVKVVRVFKEIYGVGPETAHLWYSRGCRTLAELKAGKGGVVLTPVQEIGLEFYDDIIQKMPREETKALFDLIKPKGVLKALSIDPDLFVEVMGSYRRGKSHCGDIDILISRDPSDGKTHAGVLPALLRRLHEAGIVTEDLALPDPQDDLESTYRGLCRLPDVPDSKRRRLDILCIPWHSKGAALMYYTGDDIFNRSMRLKANKMGYSLNQRGLWADVVRDPRNREKTHGGRLIASATESEIFQILDVPWQEPHQRVRNFS